MPAEPSIDILMATLQSESWLDVQLATIFAQDCNDWRLIIRDDGSTDRTAEIIRCWQSRFPDRITVLDADNPRRLGIGGNFTTLLKASRAPYVTLVSWDDVWYPDKLSLSLTAIKALEQRHGTAYPALIHTRIRMVDGNLREINGSAHKHLGLSEAPPSLGRLCLENTIYGCTIMMNRKLISMAVPIPPEAAGEDWWLALVAASFGKIGFVSQPTIDWRRHGNNTSKSNSIARSLTLFWSNPLLYREEFYRKLTTNFYIVDAFRERFGSQLAEADKQAIDAFITFASLGFWQKRWTILRHGIKYSSFTRSLGLLLFA